MEPMKLGIVEATKRQERLKSHATNIQLAYDYLLAKIPNNKLIKSFFNMMNNPQDFQYVDIIVKQIQQYQQLQQTATQLQAQNQKMVNQQNDKQPCNNTNKQNLLLLTVQQNDQIKQQVNIPYSEYQEIYQQNISMIKQIKENNKIQQYIAQNLQSLMTYINIQQDIPQYLTCEWIDEVIQTIKQYIDTISQDNKIISNTIMSTSQRKEDSLDQSQNSVINNSVIHQSDLQLDIIHLQDELQRSQQSNAKQHDIIKNQMQINKQLQQQLKKQREEIIQLQESIQILQRDAEKTKCTYSIEQSKFLKSMTEHNELSLLLNEQNKNKNVEIEQLHLQLQCLMSEQKDTSLRDQCIQQEQELQKLQNKINDLQDVNEDLRFQILQLEQLVQQQSLEKIQIQSQFNDIKDEMVKTIIAYDKQSIAQLHPGTVKDMAFYNKQLEIIQSKLNDKMQTWETEHNELQVIKQQINDKINSANEIISYLQGQANNIRESQIPIKNQAQVISENLNKTFHLLLSAAY